MSCTGDSTSKVTSADVSFSLTDVCIFKVTFYPFEFLTVDTYWSFMSSRMQCSHSQEMHRKNNWQVHWNGNQQSWHYGKQSSLISTIPHLKWDSSVFIWLSPNFASNRISSPFLAFMIDDMYTFFKWVNSAPNLNERLKICVNLSWQT